MYIYMYIYIHIYICIQIFTEINMRCHVDVSRVASLPIRSYCVVLLLFHAETATCHSCTFFATPYRQGNFSSARDSFLVCTPCVGAVVMFLKIHFMCLL